ncbi:MAG: type II secretion system protein M [Paucibacter sp.]|nr:type II secretion system protein M [Roseateles sp.]
MNTSSSTPASRWQAAAQQLQAHFAALAPREQNLVRGAGALIAFAIVWLVAVQPAWRTLRQAPAELDAVQLQQQRMQAMAAEARLLRATPVVAPDAAVQALQAASERLGKSAHLQLAGDRAVLSLQGVDPAALQQWLVEARSAARARAVEAQLQRSGQGYTGQITVTLGSAS